MHQKRSKSYITDTKNLEISIQFSLDGFSFCIANATTKKDLYFGQYSFDGAIRQPEELLTKIEPLFKADKDLQHDFRSVKVYYKNELYTLVPEPYFDEAHLSSYLDFTIKTYPSDLFAFDRLPSIEANLVYIPYVNINNFLFQNMGEFEFHHYLKLLIEKALYVNSENEMNLYVDFGKSLINIVAVHGKELSLINSFYCETHEDCLYYILFTAEQLNISNEELCLKVSGNLQKGSERYHLIEKYVKEIEFMEAKNHLLVDSSIPNHEEFALLHICE